MKTKLSFLAAIIILLLSAWTMPATNEKSVSALSVTKEKKFPPEFAFFRTHRQGKGVAASWGITSSAGVASFKLERTYEDPTDIYSEWQEVASGGCNGSKSYKCTDGNVSPGFVNYRVIAQMEDGSTIESAVETVHIVSH